MVVQIHSGYKEICMSAVTQPFLLKSTNSKHFFCENLQKIIEDFYLFTKNLFTSSMSFDVTENV